MKSDVAERLARLRAHGAWLLVGIACVGGGIIAAQNACSLALDTNANQCTADADCAALGPQFTGYVCSPELKVCISKEGFCRTNEQCITRNNPPGVDAGFKPYICRKDNNTCQAVFTDDCNTLIGKADDLNHEDVLLLGISLPTTGATARNGLAAKHGIDIMQAEFQEVLTGISVPKAPARPLVWVLCNEGGKDPVANVNHLIDDLGVPALVGPQNSGPAVSIMQKSLLVPRHVLSMSHTATTTLLVPIPGKVPYMYRFNASDQDIATVQALLVQKVWEPSLRAQGIVGPTENIRVMILAQQDSLGLSVTTAVQKTLQFNCQSGTCLTAQQNSDANNLKVQDAGDPTDQKTYTDRVNAAVAAALTYQPHVVILSGSGSSIDGLTALEKALQALTPPPAFFPRYSLASPLTAADWPTIVGTNEALRTRLLGGRPGPTAAEPRYAALKPKYDQRFADDTTTQFSGQTALAYDAAWVLALAIEATSAQGKPLTGDNISPNVRLMQGGATLIQPDNPQNFINALNTLQKGGSISYDGTSGPAAWDQNQDQEPSIFSYCIGLPDAGGTRVIGSGLTFDKAAQQLKGNLKCFSLPDGGGTGTDSGTDSGIDSGIDSGSQDAASD